MKLKESRERKGVTQKEVANAIGCSAVVYSRYETGAREPDIHTSWLLAKYYQTSIEDLFELYKESDLI